jgi:hypothetical protein
VKIIEKKNASLDLKDTLLHTLLQGVECMPTGLRPAAPAPTKETEDDAAAAMDSGLKAPVVSKADKHWLE